MKVITSKDIITSESGVTLIEAMIYIALAGMMLGLAVTAFLGQNKSYNRQDVITEIQQNLRGATEQMASDIRFAGLGLKEPGEEEDAFFLAAADYFSVNYWSDLSNEYWRPDVMGEKKTIHYRLNTDENRLERAYTRLSQTPVSDDWETLAENIDVIRFEYQIDNDEDPWIWENSVTGSDNFNDIRAVKVMILGSSRDSAFNQTVDGTFVFPTDDEVYSYTAPPNSGYKRLMSTVVQTRNNRD